jgi:rare lipoprotein A
VTPTATLPRVGRVAPSMAAGVQQPYSPPPAAAPAYTAPLYATPSQSSYVAPPAAASPAGRQILIASPDDPDAADALASGLADEGAHVVATGGGYRVVTGPYADDQGLAAALARLRARGYQGASVINLPDPNGPSHP